MSASGGKSDLRGSRTDARYSALSATAPVNTPLLADDVIRAVRRAILRGELEPGTHLTERGIGAMFGVSSIVMREVFARLDDEGLVVRKPRRGAFVASMSIDEFSELTEVRVVIEQLSVELAMKKWSANDDRRIRAIVDDMFTAAHKNDSEEFFQLDERFHEEFARLAANEVLLDVASHLRRRVSRFLLRSDVGLDSDALVSSAKAHEAWLAQVRKGTPKSAKDEVRKHIVNAAEGVRARIVGLDAHGTRAGLSSTA